MAQVVTNENMMELITTGKVAPFKPPEAAKPDGDKAAGTDPGAKPDAVSAKSSNGEAKAGSVQPRDAGGKFRSPSGEQSPSEQSKDGPAAPQPAVDDEKDPDGEGLTEHARRVIAKKHRRQKEAEEFARERDADAAAERARADALERQLNELRGGKAKSGDGPAAGDGKDDESEPKPEDFKTVGEYTRALTKYLVDKKATEAGEANARQSAADRAKAQAEETTTAFVKRQSEFMKATPDYEEVVGESELDVPSAGMQYIVESEMGPHLAYHLAKNPDVVERLSKLSPARCVAELGKLEARLEEAAKGKPNGEAKPNGETREQPTRQVSRAPAPIQPLNGGDAATPVHKDPSQMTFQELRAFRIAERAAGRRN